MPECNAHNIDLIALFDEMLAQMQEPGQREAMDKAFRATPEELGNAAVGTTIDGNAKFLVGKKGEIARKAEEAKLEQNAKDIKI
jgi:hypothetical protein